MSQEKQRIQEDLEKKAQIIEQTANANEKRLTEEHKWQIESLEQKHREEKEQQRRESDILNENLKQV
jgi:hypothetical protein